jgi:mannose-6-phosphate isomerase
MRERRAGERASLPLVGSPAVDLARIRLLENPVQHYAWGSRTAIPELLGCASPASEPWAELWIGAHLAPSRVTGDDHPEPLDAYIARDPAAVLGAQTAARFDAKLPFLLKVLAAAEPLSIQAHPSLAQAREGFARENRAGIALDAPNRCYRDAQHKPELICALTPFHALNRFREPREIAERLASLGEPALAELVAALRARPDRNGLAAFFATLWTLGPAARGAAVKSALAWARAERSRDPAARWIDVLARRHPDDVGVLAPLLLHVVELAPGEAMFLPAGELHSYLEGVGIEIMASSDNVLRGGLTPKHVDVPELLRTLSFRAGPVERLRPQPVANGEARYDTPAEEFALSVLDVRAGAPHTAPRARSVEILLCTQGRGQLVGAQTHEVARGDAFLVPAAAPGYRIDGDLVIYRAAPGSAPH